jgi:tetratricopeptide (TPR) repeat protein
MSPHPIRSYNPRRAEGGAAQARSLPAVMAESSIRPSRIARPDAPFWIYNPGLDMIVGCGAWSAPLLLLAYVSVSSNTLRWSLAFYALALFFNYPHYMATIYRAYHRSEDFNKYRIFTVHVTLLLVLTAVITHFWFGALPLIFTLYLTWSPWHYSGQNYGIFMMFARRAGAKPTSRERRTLYAAFLISYAILFLNFHTGRSTDPMFVSLNIPGTLSSLLQIVLALAFVACSAYGLSRLIGQAGWREMVPSLTLFSTQFVWFLLPTVLSLGEGFSVPQSRYSTGVLAVMHSAQYLWITSYYARREATAEGRQSWRPFAYFAVLVAGGIALFVPGPWIASHVFHYDFTRSFLIFTALVNIHHFILDGAIWKLRDGRIANLLLDSQTKVADAARNAGGSVALALRWLLGEARGARTMRVGTALALLAWGSVDQVRYYFALHQDNLPDLQRAAALTSYDTPLEMKLARKQLDAGQPAAAIAAWKQAMRADPADPAPRNALLQYLTSHKRIDEAYDLTRTAMEHAPRDTQLLINHGSLAMQLGHPDEALRSWQKAVTTDPKQADARLFLAAELDREGKPGEAVPQYAAFLEIVAHQGAVNRPPAPQLIGVVLKTADCQVRADHPEQGVRSYELARKIAAQTGEGQLESFATINEAVLQARTGKTDEALHLYQHALQLDASLSDRHSEAVDWYAYAVFLRDAGFPARLAYASLLKSEMLMKSSPNPSDQKSLDKTLAEFEKPLGAEAATIRRDPEPLQQQALTLARPSAKIRVSD